jgi:hypothetical protein
LDKKTAMNLLNQSFNTYIGSDGDGDTVDRLTPLGGAIIGYGGVPYVTDAPVATCQENRRVAARFLREMAYAIDPDVEEKK